MGYLKRIEGIWIDPASVQYIFNMDGGGSVVGVDGHDFEMDSNADDVAAALGETLHEAIRQAAREAGLEFAPEPLKPWAHVRAEKGDIVIRMNVEAAELLTCGEGYEGLELSERGALIREMEAAMSGLEAPAPACAPEPVRLPERVVLSGEYCLLLDEHGERLTQPQCEIVVERCNAYPRLREAAERVVHGGEGRRPEYVEGTGDLLPLPATGKDS